MDTSSLAELIEYAIADHEEKRLTGSLEDFARLLSDENLASLEAAYDGIFAFLVFHPAADGPVSDYARNLTLASDSGPRILTFYTTDEDSVAPSPSSTPADIAVDGDVHLAYEVTRLLFSPQVPPPLPGVVFASRLSGTNDAVYVPLSESTDEDAVRSHLRLVFSLADSALGDGGDREKFPNRFAKELLSEDIAYHRSGRRSLGEWLAMSYHFLVDRGFELVTVLGGVSGRLP
ncbi:hypothetical protein ACFVZC_04650 [Streptomyces marokkonensis]|uniref:Uncharacterized protein n=1 Tax=Streptomyces marokkonensis TaxID=324855 RepID=A0ABW6Q0T1_9ACTN